MVTQKKARWYGGAFASFDNDGFTVKFKGELGEAPSKPQETMSFIMLWE